MVVHKIVHILNGDPDYTDSWHDIGGYVKLVEDRLTAGRDDPTEQAALGAGPGYPHW